MTSPPPPPDPPSSPKVQVMLSRNAERQLDKHDHWWRNHRPANPLLFAREYLLAYELLRVRPSIGARYVIHVHEGDLTIRRYALRTGHALYYTAQLRDEADPHDLSPSVVIILAIRGPGEAGPRF